MVGGSGSLARTTSVIDTKYGPCALSELHPFISLSLVEQLTNLTLTYIHLLYISRPADTQRVDNLCATPLDPGSYAYRIPTEIRYCDETLGMMLMRSDPEVVATKDFS